MSNTPGDAVFGPAFSLICGRIAAHAAALLVPVVIARTFAPAEFGTYKQLFIIAAVLSAFAELGIAESLYYFIPSQPREGGRYSFNVLLVLSTMGVAALTALLLLGRPIAGTLSNPALNGYFPLLSAYVAASLASAPLEIVLIARSRHRWASLAYAFSGVARGSFILVPMTLWPRLETLLAGATAFAIIRVFVLLSYLRFEFGEDLRPDMNLLIAQLKYSIPLQAAVCLEILQSNFHLLAVSRSSDSATFAVYSIGCMQIPLIDLIGSSACTVMMVRMSESIRLGQTRAALETWLDTSRGIALRAFPLIGLLFALSADLIPFLYTDAYAASVPIFRIWIFVLVIMTLQPHALLRVSGDTRFLAAQNFLKLAFVVISIDWFISEFRLTGAVLATAAATLLGKGLSLTRMKQIGNIPIGELLPWRSLGETAAITSGAVATAVSLRSNLSLSHVSGMMVSGSLFAAIFGVSAWRLGLLTPEEKKRLSGVVEGWLLRPRRAPEKSGGGGA